MSGKTFGPSSRDSSRSPSPTSTKSASPKATPNLTSEGVSPGSPKAKASPEKSKEKTKDKTEKNKGGKSQGNPGKDKKPGKPTGEEFYSSIPAGTPFAKLGSLKDVAADPEAFPELLVQKLELCMQVYNFQKDDCMPEKEGKRFTLLEILHYWPSIEKEEVSKTRSNKKSPAISADDAVNSSTGPLFSSAGTESSEVSAKALTTPVLAAAVKVVRANAFRSMMHKERTPMDLLDGDDDEPLLEPTWPHLELVYELLMKIISAKDVDYSAAQSAGLDAGEMLNKVVKEVLPSIPKKQRAQASFVAMSKGSVADCPVFHTAKGTPARVFVGVGWDFFDDKTSKIDVALVFFSMDGHHISTVSKDGETIKGAFHTGHGALSAGVFVEFDLLPIEVSVAFLVAHVSTEGSDYSTVQQPHCTVIDAQGREILRYFMPEDKRKPSGQTGLIMARMFWNQFHERWSFQALGNYCGGSSWSDSLEDMKALVTIPPSHFQTLLIEDEDSVMRGDHRSTTAASSSAQSVIMSL